MVEDGDVSAYEAVRDPSSAVYVVALHNDGVFYLGVTDCCVISDARVWAEEGVETNLAMVSDYDGGSYRCAAVDDLARAENAPVYAFVYGTFLLASSFLGGF